MLRHLFFSIALMTALLAFTFSTIQPSFAAEPSGDAEKTLKSLYEAWHRGDPETVRKQIKTLNQLLDETTNQRDKSRVNYWIGLGWRNHAALSGERMEGLRKAVSHLEDSVKQDPRNAEAHALLASALRGLIGLGERDADVIHQQIEHRELAYKLGATNPRVLMLEATALISIPESRGGDIDEGIATALEAAGRFELEDSSVANWGKAECWALVGSAYRKKKDINLARKAYQKALRIQPDWKAIKETVLPGLK